MFVVSSILLPIHTYVYTQRTSIVNLTLQPLSSTILSCSGGPLGDILDAALTQLREMTLSELIGEEGVAAVLGTASTLAVPVAPPSTSTSLAVSLSTPRTDAPNSTSSGGSGILPRVVEVVCGLIRSGVGLPTRGATSKFIISLSGDLPDSALQHAAVRPLLNTLMGAFEDSSPTLRREFMSAAAHIRCVRE